MDNTKEFLYDNWYLTFTEEQRPIVDNWRINIIKYHNTPCPTNIINWTGAMGYGRVGVQITFEEFCKYVLNKPIETEKPQDYEYLIEILNR